MCCTCMRLVRLHRSIGHVNHSKVRRQPEAKPRAATARGGRTRKPMSEVELLPKRPATAAPPGAFPGSD
eukprot:1137602-Pelagomonas_calceolata.AAC.2